MSSTNPHDHPHAPETPQTPQTPPPLPRRRLLKFGASAVPVALTLASRPSFAAGQCNTTSAWGSAVLRNGTGSVAARAAAARLDNPIWSISQLIHNNGMVGVAGGAQPWNYIFQQRYAGSGSNQPESHARSHLRVTDLFPGGIVGFGGQPALVSDWLAANPNPSNFVTAMLAARINALYAGNAAGACLGTTDNVLTEMATGSYQPSNGAGTPWNRDEILRYLVDNHYVVA